MLAETFEQELKTRLGEDYRLRWSESRHVWMIEQQAGKETSVPVESGDDVAIRARDGYTLVMEFSDIPTAACPQCFQRYTLPHLKIGEVKCRMCDALGYDRQIMTVGFFPLCDALLEYLERTSLKRHDAWRKEFHARAEKLKKDRKRKFDNHCEAVGKDYYNNAAGVLQFGYTKAGTPHAYGR